MPLGVGQLPPPKTVCEYHYDLNMSSVRLRFGSMPGKKLETHTEDKCYSRHCTPARAPAFHKEIVEVTFNIWNGSLTYSSYQTKTKWERKVTAILVVTPIDTQEVTGHKLLMWSKISTCIPIKHQYKMLLEKKNYLMNYFMAIL